MAAPTKFSSGGRHNRHHSWPPIQLRPSHLDHHHKYARKTKSSSIDDDPFAFFLSTDEDDEEEGYISDWMNAKYKDLPRSKSESPVGRRGKIDGPKASSERQESPRTAISRLTLWLDKMEKMYFCRKDTLQEPKIMKQGSPEMLPKPLPISPHVRGRKTSRRTSLAVGNRMVRSHSGRPRVWQEPGAAIYTLSEQEELDDTGLGISI